MKIPIGCCLEHRRFGVYVAGNLVSLVGTWMHRVGVSWLTWEQTRSAEWLGIVSAAELLPSVFLSPLGGALADRFNKRVLMIASQCAAFTVAVVFAAAVRFGVATPAVLAGLAFLFGAANAIDNPARLAFVPDLVPAEQLPSANSTNAIFFHCARFAGSAAAAVVLHMWGVEVVFILNAASYFPFIFALHLLREGASELRAAPAGALGVSVVEGWRHVARCQPVRRALLLLVTSSVTGRAYFEFAPWFADHVFHGGATVVAVLGAAAGIGSLVGGMACAVVAMPMARLALWGAAVMCIGQLTFSVARSLGVGVTAVFLTGVGSVLNGVALQSHLQADGDPRFRGRVMSLYGLVFRGAPAVGAVAIGMCSRQHGPPLPLAAGALLVGAISVQALCAPRLAGRWSTEKS